MTNDAQVTLTLVPWLVNAKTFCVKNEIKQQTTLVFVWVRQKNFDAKQPNIRAQFPKFCQNLRPPPPPCTSMIMTGRGGRSG